MQTRRVLARTLAALSVLPVLARSRATQAASPPPPADVTGGPGMETLTIFLRHDETKTLDEINRHLKETGWFAQFPPPWAEVLSWYVMMGIGQVVTLRFPAERLRDVNTIVEKAAWGGFHTEFYPTYDYRALYRQQKRAEQ